MTPFLILKIAVIEQSIFGVAMSKLWRQSRLSNYLLVARKKLCPWQGGWKLMIFMIPSNSNHSVIPGKH